MTAARVRIVSALFALSLAACAGPARERVDGWSGVGSGETVVVGRIELVPPLRKGEQRIDALNSGSYENLVYLMADDRNRVLPDEPKTADFDGRIEATLEQTFFVRSSDHPFYILGGVLWLEIGRGQNKAYFPGGLRVPVRTGDKAVYVGTVRYYRDEFWNFSKVTIVDDYDRANAEYRKKFGTKIALRKALLAPVK
jgi:hypothetical protein